MPRLSPRLFRKASRIHNLLPLLLQSTRDLDAARNELRWLKEHAIAVAQADSRHVGWRGLLRAMCVERGRGKPLQYLLGTEYFGDLELKCRPGVLIPRQETAASVANLVARLGNDELIPKPLRMLDLCTGTGCIPLLFRHEFYKEHSDACALRIAGVDLSPKAISLSLRNSHLHEGSSGKIDFVQANVLASEDQPSTGSCPSLRSALESLHDHHEDGTWDILISNPPYISPTAFNHTTSRSVRNFEPRLALVPREQTASLSSLDAGDIFYPRLLDVAEKLDVKVVLFEVADLEQAKRVANMARRQSIWSCVEIWRDDPVKESGCDGERLSDGTEVIGTGHGRSVFAWRGSASKWIKDV